MRILRRSILVVLCMTMLLAGYLGVRSNWSENVPYQVFVSVPFVIMAWCGVFFWKEPMLARIGIIGTIGFYVWAILSI